MAAIPLTTIICEPTSKKSSITVIDNTRLSPKVVLRNLVNKFNLLIWFLEVTHLTEGVSVLKVVVKGTAAIFFVIVNCNKLCAPHAEGKFNDSFFS